MAAAALALAVTGQQLGWLWALAGGVGALGGLAHEFAQSGGKIRFFQKRDDGYYLGSVSGMCLGAAAGLLIVRGLLGAQHGSDGLAPAGGDATSQAGLVQVWYEAFFAGLGLKGVTEALGGKAIPPAADTALSPTDTRTALQLLDSIEPDTPPKP
jgi:hypothetical protein